MRILSLIICCCLAVTIQAQEQKEVLIIGTMHMVPKIIKNSYKPLLKEAKKYDPQAIYVERVRPEDTLSLKNDYPEFLHLSDSISQIFEVDEVKFNDLMAKDLKEMKKQDFEYLSRCFIVKRDFANHRYYRYLSRYHLQGSKKPLRHENADLTAKLAIYQNMKFIYSMDDQQENLLYFKEWQTCAKEGASNGNEKIINKMLRNMIIKAGSAAVVGRLGYRTNRPKELENMHLINSFEYVKVNTEACSLGNKYWDNRNFRMVKNIAEQVYAQDHQRNIVIVGAGHVYGMKEAFEKHYPDIKVKLLGDVK